MSEAEHKRLVCARYAALITVGIHVEVELSRDDATALYDLITTGLRRSRNLQSFNRVLEANEQGGGDPYGRQLHRFLTADEQLRAWINVWEDDDGVPIVGLKQEGHEVIDGIRKNFSNNNTSWVTDLYSYIFDGLLEYHNPQNSQA